MLVLYMKLCVFMIGAAASALRMSHNSHTPRKADLWASSGGNAIREAWFLTGSYRWLLSHASISHAHI